MAAAEKADEEMARRQRERPQEPDEDGSNESGREASSAIALPAWAAGAELPLVVRLEKGRTAASPAQRAAIEHLERNQVEVMEKVRAALFAEYQAQIATVEELGLTQIRRASRIREHVELSVVIVHASSHAGFAYVGLAFRCAWEAEHDLGLLLHRQRIVKLGYADTATLWWVGRAHRSPR